MNKIILCSVLVAGMFGCSTLDEEGAAGLSKDTCITCHAVPSQSTLHLALKTDAPGFDCQACHVGLNVSDGKYAIASPAHMNGVVDSSYNTVWLNQKMVISSTNYESQTCSAIACHELPAATGIHHLTDTNTYAYSCATCHEGYAVGDSNYIHSTNHANDVVNVHYAPVWGAGSTQTMEGQTCSNIACHGAGKENASGIEWNSASTMDTETNCKSCHNTSPEIGAKHKGGIANCSMCHSSVVTGPEDSLRITDFSKHINGQLDLN